MSLRAIPYGVVVGAVCFAALARAQLVPRLSVEQRGDVLLIGNTLAQNCSDDVPEPVVGDVGACGADADDSGADVLWSVDADGQTVIANTSVDPDEAASVAVLALPEGASVTHARLYWSAAVGGGDRTLATLSRVAGASLAVDGEPAPLVEEDGNTFYQTSADVTAFVQASGSGAYRLSGMAVADPGGNDDTSHYAGWWLVVFYSLSTDPVRHLGLYDGLERVTDEASTSLTLDGFEIPPGGVEARLGVVGYEGDGTLDGDTLRVGPTAPLGNADAVGRVDNFFDASRRGVTGEVLAAVGDLPQTSGAPDSLSGVDLHQVDVAAALAPGQTSVEVEAATTNDHFFLAGLVLSAVTTAPELALSRESVRDINGPPLRPGDELEFSIEVNNSGTGAAPLVTVRAALPPTLRYVPNSLSLGSADATLALTDVADVDGGELESSAEPVLVLRLGTGEGASGGALEVGETRAVSYRVTVAPEASGSILSQAELLATSASGAIIGSALSDSDLASPGVSPTEIVIDGCGSDAECAGSTARCDLSGAPTRCVQCLSDADCAGLAPSCDATRACVCQGSGAEEALCDGKDDDCDGQIDEGLAGAACEVGLGACRVTGVLVCDTGGEVRCSAEPGPAQPERCENGEDDDCDGEADEADCAGAAPLAGDSPRPVASAPVEPSSSRTPEASLAPAPASTPRRPSDDGAGVSLGGGAACQLQAGPPQASAAGWLALGLGLVCAGRRARRRASAAR